MREQISWQDPTVPHEHQCGVTILGPLPGYGCGHIWTHSGPPKVNDEEYAKRHMCPKCGKGPWFWVVEDENA